MALNKKLRAYFAFQNYLAIIRPLGLVAQSVEQRIENPCVGGSIPPRATKEIKHLVQPGAGLFVLARHFSDSVIVGPRWEKVRSGDMFSLKCVYCPLHEGSDCLYRDSATSGVAMYITLYPRSFLSQARRGAPRLTLILRVLAGRFACESAGKASIALTLPPRRRPTTP